MLGRSTSARAAASSASSQDAFKGQFDDKMGSLRLIWGNTQFQQFADFQQALANATSICCSRQAEDVKHLITELEEVAMMESKRLEGDVIITPGGTLKFTEYHEDK